MMKLYQCFEYSMFISETLNKTLCDIIPQYFDLDLDCLL